MDNIASKIEEYSFQYRELYTECYNLLVQLSDKSIDNIVISGFVEAKYCEATPTTLKFTHETWDYVHKEIEKKHEGKKIVGWIHTHPDFGIFLSEYDKFIHQNFFSEDYQVAYVVDPIQQIEGFYFWINGNIEKCKGFYIYDKTGTKITVDAGKDEPDTEKAETSGFGVQSILIAILSVAVIFLIFSNISTNNKLAQMEKKQEALETQQVLLVNSANQSLSQMQQTINSQDAKIQQLETVLKDAGILADPEAPVTPDADVSDGNGETEEGIEEPSTDDAADSEIPEITDAVITDPADAPTEGGTTVNE
jgi:proteasome lid subunit RPN8/RPN11